MVAGVTSNWAAAAKTLVVTMCAAQPALHTLFKEIFGRIVHNILLMVG